MDTEEIDLGLLMARQPVIDREKNSFGYELHYKNKQEKFIPLLAGNHRTAQALLNRFASLPADRKIENGRKPVFINLATSRLLADALPALLFPAVIVELNPDAAQHTDELLRYKKKHQQVLKLCLSHFSKGVYPEALIKIADFVSIDLAYANSQALTQLSSATNVFLGKKIFKNIETAEDFCKALDHGGDLFSGNFLITPEVVDGVILSGGTQATMRLLSELYDPDTTPEKIERVIVADSILTTQLLRLINSAAFGMARKIESIQEAIVFLGFSMLQQWVSLLVLSSQQNKSAELLRMNLVRAAFCRDLAQLLETVAPEKAFLMGLMSMIDVFLDYPLADLLHDLPLADDINQALLHERGPLGDILCSIRQYEAAAWPSLSQQQLAEDVWGNLYQGALVWADDTIRLIGLDKDG